MNKLKKLLTTWQGWLVLLLVGFGVGFCLSGCSSDTPAQQESQSATQTDSATTTDTSVTDTASATESSTETATDTSTESSDQASSSQPDPNDSDTYKLTSSEESALSDLCKAHGKTYDGIGGPDWSHDDDQNIDELQYRFYCK